MRLEVSLRDRSSVACLPATRAAAMSMTSGPDRIRVALAMFDRSNDLCRALVDFDRAGLSAEQIGLAGQASAMSAVALAIEQGAFGPDSLTGLMEGVAPLGIVAGREAVLVTGGPLWPALSCFGVGTGGSIITAPWMAPQLSHELSTHIANGAVLFGARARSVEQQRACTQILLNHSSHRVHTHEFKL